MCIFNIVSCVLFCHWRKEFWALRPPPPDPPATRQTNKPTPGQGGRTVVGLSAFFLSRTKSPHSSDYYDIADCITFHHTDLHTPRIAHKLWASFLSCTNRDHYCLLIPATRISAPALRPFQAPRCCSSCWWKIFNFQKNFIQKKSTKKYFKKLKNYKNSIQFLLFHKHQQIVSCALLARASLLHIFFISFIESVYYSLLYSPCIHRHAQRVTVATSSASLPHSTNTAATPGERRNTHLMCSVPCNVPSKCVYLYSEYCLHYTTVQWSCVTNTTKSLMCS